MAEQRRLFVGGLINSVTGEELHEKFSRFGEVTNVEVKTRKTETETKTFAYVNVTADENSFKKCFTAFNNAKWKGGQLKVQFAKESFLDKLKKEQEEAKKPQRIETKPLKSPALKEGNTKGVPGTLVDEDGKWVVGKYSRILPILHVKKPDTRKLVTLDPSKHIHALKKLKVDDVDADPSSLTWSLSERDSEIAKKRQGVFPSWQPQKKDKKDSDAVIARLKQLTGQQGSDTEMEVVPVGKPVPKPLTVPQSLNGYHSDSSDMDDLLTQTKQSSAKLHRSAKKIHGSATKSLPASNTVKMLQVRKSNEKASTPKTSNCGYANDEVLVKNTTPIEENVTSTENGKLRQTKSITEEGFRPLSGSKVDEELHLQFKFVQTPTAVGKYFKKAGSQNKTPPFRGLGMLRRSANDSHTLSTPVSLKTVQPDEKEAAEPQTKANSSDMSSPHSVSASTTPIRKVHAPVQKAQTPVQTTSDKQTVKGEVTSESRKRTLSASSTGANYFPSEETSLSVPPTKKRHVKAAHGDTDSDLEDNDFEKVGQKLAARARQRGEMVKEDQRIAAGEKKKRTSFGVASGKQDSDENSLKQCHLAHQKNTEVLKKQNSLVTKAIREGAGSKHVKFDALDVEENTSVQEQENGTDKITQKKKLQLFNSDSENADEEEDLPSFWQPQFHGTKGQKLLDLQSKVQFQVRDPRFRFDDKFVETDSEEEEPKEALDPDEAELAEEKARNLRILEKVLGFKPREKKRPPIVDMNQIRFDPLKAAQSEAYMSTDKSSKTKENNDEDGNDRNKIAMARNDSDKDNRQAAEESDMDHEESISDREQNNSDDDNGSGESYGNSDESEDCASDHDKDSHKEGVVYSLGENCGDDENEESCVNRVQEKQNDCGDDGNEEDDDSDNYVADHDEHGDDQNVQSQNQKQNNSSEEDDDSDNYVGEYDEDSDDKDMKYSLVENSDDEIEESDDDVEHGKQNDSGDDSSKEDDESGKYVSDDDEDSDDKDVKYSLVEDSDVDEAEESDDVRGQGKQNDSGEDDSSEEDDDSDKYVSDYDEDSDDEDIVYSLATNSDDDDDQSDDDREQGKQNDSGGDDSNEEDDEYASSSNNEKDDGKGDKRIQVRKVASCSSDEDDDSSDDDQDEKRAGDKKEAASDDHSDEEDNANYTDSVETQSKQKEDAKENAKENARNTEKESAVTFSASPGLGNFFTGGDSFTFFDESPSTKAQKQETMTKARQAKEEIEEEMDVVAEEDKKQSSEVSAISARKRKLNAEPSFCITRNSKRLEVGTLASKQDDMDYSELRKVFQHLVKELHKRALRKQKKQFLERRKKSKFAGGAKKKTFKR